MDGTKRADIRPGMRIQVVLKKDPGARNLTEGIVAEILTNSSAHPHGIKVRLASGAVGRVRSVL